MSRLNFAIGLVVVGVLFVIFSLSQFYSGGGQEDRELSASPTNLGFDPTARPTHGGPFTLVDHTGKAVTDKNYRGNYLLVFFGYTYCPDVCPTELQMLSDVMDILGDAGGKVQPLFVTVDPERDTPEVLADYVGSFHPRLIGLTGTPEQVAAAAMVYKASYVKLEDPNPGDDSSGDEYFMGHTSFTYLVGPDGKMLFTFPRGIGPREVAKAVSGHLGVTLQGAPS